MKERLEGFEYRKEDGKTLVIIPVTSHERATYVEVHKQLVKDGDDVVSEPMDCLQAYIKAGSCGVSTGKVVFIRYEFTGDVTHGYPNHITKVYDIIRNIDFMKRIGRWKGSL